MAKYTYRYYAKTWTDINVEADNPEDALALADEKYNAGDYDDCSENFENTEVVLLENHND